MLEWNESLKSIASHPPPPTHGLAVNMWHPEKKNDLLNSQIELGLKPRCLSSQSGDLGG